jgi:hypothetical protein
LKFALPLSFIVKAYLLSRREHADLSDRPVAPSTKAAVRQNRAVGCDFRYKSRSEYARASLLTGEIRRGIIGDAYKPFQLIAKWTQLLPMDPGRGKQTT